MLVKGKNIPDVGPEKQKVKINERLKGSKIHIKRKPEVRNNAASQKIKFHKELLNKSQTKMENAEDLQKRIDTSVKKCMKDMVIFGQKPLTPHATIPQGMTFRDFYEVNIHQSPQSPEKNRSTPVRPKSAGVQVEILKAQKEIINGKKRPETAGKMKPDKDPYDWHWLTWKGAPEKPQKGRNGARPHSTQVFYPGYPNNPKPPYRPNTSIDYYPAMEYQKMSPTPSHLLPNEPRENFEIYSPAFNTWVNNAADYEKDVVFNMMDSINQYDSTQRPITPSSPVRMTKYTNRGNHAGIRTVPNRPASPKKGQINYSFKNTYGTNSVNDLSKYLNQMQIKQGYKPRQKILQPQDYIHQGSSFYNSQMPYRSNFTIHPDWVSERISAAKEMKDMQKRRMSGLPERTHWIQHTK